MEICHLRLWSCVSCDKSKTTTHMNTMSERDLSLFKFDVSFPKLASKQK